MDTSRAQDREDVARVLAGDVDAFEGIVRRWQGPLVTLAYRYCRDPGRAEELAQEAFVRAFRKLGQWRGDAAFSTWLFALAINVCRTEVRRGRLSEVPLEMAPEPGRAPDVVERLATNEVNRAIRGVVGTLPRKYRDAVVLYYFSGMDVAQAARSLDVPPGTLKARLHRARGLLKDRLSRIMGPADAEEQR